MSTRRAQVVSGPRDERSGGAPATGVLFDIKRFALHDGPGIRTTVFLKGCPLSCRWCHNPESQSREPEFLFWEERCSCCGACASACTVKAISVDGDLVRTDRSVCTACGECVTACPRDARAIAGEPWSTDHVLEEIEKDLLFYDESDGGITLSGGEPLAQPLFSISVLTECRARRIHTAVDTCGHAEWAILERVAGVTDLFLYDVKHMNSARHQELTGVSNERILKNLRRLDTAGCALWIRYPIIPDVNDADEDVIALGEFVADLRSVESVHLLPFHRGGERKQERLGRPSHTLTTKRDPRSAADAAARILRTIVDVPVHVGG